MKSTPEFYIGAPVDPVDLRFREAFLAELWQTLSTGHVVLTAPRRTGKTSVMDYLRDHPEKGFSVVSINVQDLTHPADFFQVLLDGLPRCASGFRARPTCRRLGTGQRRARKGRRNRCRRLQAWHCARAIPTGARTGASTATRFSPMLAKPVPGFCSSSTSFPTCCSTSPGKMKGCSRDFLAWFRTQRQNPAPARDSVRWLVGGSVNLAGTLDALGLVDRINDLEDVSLPPLTDSDIETFVTEMLGGRDVPFDDEVPQRLIARLGRPIPFFMQMATQDLYRLWKREQRRIVAADVDAVFEAMVVGSAARTRLQHFHSRIRQYYAEPKHSIAHALLGQISVSDVGAQGAQLCCRRQNACWQTSASHSRRMNAGRCSTSSLLDLENDFYIVEVEEAFYDFASGVLKSWWRKYHA